jgi:hypothetical protein
MNPLRILYIGDLGGTCLQRARALERLGHDVHVLSPNRFTTTSRPVCKWIVETGGLGFEGYVRRRILAALPQTTFDLVWVDNGALIGPFLVRELQRRYGTVLNYNLDDPFGSRDRHLWRIYRKAVPLYDLIVVVRQENPAEARSLGARRVLKVLRSADEVAHAPRQLDNADWGRWGSDVIFVGTWMPERGPFMAELARRGVPLTIYGEYWHRAKEWPVLARYWRGPGLYQSDDYAKAIQCSKVCLGLLSKENRDLHTTRSMEIPHLGGLLCAKRTTEHCLLYKENEEAIFWSNAEECARKCFQLLSDTELRVGIAARGRNRCISNLTTNERVLSAILHEALSVHCHFGFSARQL